MKPGALIAGVVVVGYIAFEVYALYHNRDRADPVNIYDQFITARHAVARCGDPPADQLDRFSENLHAVTIRATRTLKERNPQASSDEIDDMVAAISEQRAQEIDALVAAQGCSAPQIKTNLKRFEIKARLRARVYEPAGADPSRS